MEGLLINYKLSYTNDRAKEELDKVTLFLPLIFIIPTLNAVQYNWKVKSYFLSQKFKAYVLYFSSKQNINS